MTYNPPVRFKSNNRHILVYDSWKDYALCSKGSIYDFVMIKLDKPFVLVNRSDFPKPIIDGLKLNTVGYSRHYGMYMLEKIS